MSGQMLRSQADISVQVPMPTDRVDDTSTATTVAAEAIVWSYVAAGAWSAAVGQAAGTLVTGKTVYTGILNSFNTAVGSFNDTSVVFAVAVRFNVYVSVPEKVFSEMTYMSPTDQRATMLNYLTTNGNYTIDHRKGQLWGRSLAVVANDTIAYAYSSNTVSLGPSPDINIGDVQIDAATSTVSGTVTATTPALTTVRVANANRYTIVLQNAGANRVHFGAGVVTTSFPYMEPGGTASFPSQEACVVLAASGTSAVNFTEYTNSP